MYKTNSKRWFLFFFFEIEKREERERDEKKKLKMLVFFEMNGSSTDNVFC